MMVSASGKPALPDAAPESLRCLIKLAGRKGRATPCRVSVRRFAGRGSPGEERGQRRVRARHQDRDPRRGGQVADHHRGHALAARVEEQHVLRAQAGQRAGPAGCRRRGRPRVRPSRSPARRPRSGPTARWPSARGCLGHVGGGGRSGRGGRAEQGGRPAARRPGCGVSLRCPFSAAGSGTGRHRDQEAAVRRGQARVCPGPPPAGGMARAQTIRVAGVPASRYPNCVGSALACQPPGAY